MHLRHKPLDEEHQTPTPATPARPLWERQSPLLQNQGTARNGWCFKTTEPGALYEK